MNFLLQLRTHVLYVLPCHALLDLQGKEETHKNCAFSRRATPNLLAKHFASHPKSLTDASLTWHHGDIKDWQCDTRLSLLPHSGRYTPSVRCCMPCRWRKVAPFFACSQWCQTARQIRLIPNLQHRLWIATEESNLTLVFFFLRSSSTPCQEVIDFQAIAKEAAYFQREGAESPSVFPSNVTVHMMSINIWPSKQLQVRSPSRNLQILNQSPTIVDHVSSQVNKKAQTHPVSE